MLDVGLNPADIEPTFAISGPRFVEVGPRSIEIPPSCWSKFRFRSKLGPGFGPRSVDPGPMLMDSAKFGTTSTTSGPIKFGSIPTLAEICPAFARFGPAQTKSGAGSVGIGPRLARFGSSLTDITHIRREFSEFGQTRPGIDQIWLHFISGQNPIHVGQLRSGMGQTGPNFDRCWTTSPGFGSESGERNRGRNGKQQPRGGCAPQGTRYGTTTSDFAQGARKERIKTRTAEPARARYSELASRDGHVRPSGCCRNNPGVSTPMPERRPQTLGKPPGGVHGGSQREHRTREAELNDFGRHSLAKFGAPRTTERDRLRDAEQRRVRF